MAVKENGEVESGGGWARGGSESAAKVEHYLNRIGTWNRFPLLVYFLLASAQIVTAFQWLASSFINGEPPHRCKLPSGEEAASAAEVSRWIPQEMDDKSGEMVNSKCKIFTEPGVSNHTEKCDSWWYDTEFGNTAINEWDLICDNSELAARLTSVFFAGILLGCLLLPTLSDLFGRKRMMIIYLLLSIPFGLGASFADSWITLAAIKFFIAFFISGGVMCQYILVCEFFPSQHRSFAGHAIWFMWTIGYMLLPLLAYYIRDWRDLQLTITVWLLPLAISYIWLVPESIHYLISKGKVSDAEQILQKGADMNKVDLKVSLTPVGGPGQAATENKLHHNESSTDPAAEELSEKKYNLYHVICTKYFNIMALLMCFVWMVNSLVYYGLSLNTSALAGDRFMNFFISGAVEVPAYAVCIVTMKYIGRRVPCCAFHIIGGLPLFITLFIPFQTEDGADLSWLHTTLVMIGKFGITASFSGIYLQATELYPTVVRNAGLGLSSTFARIGGILAPYTIHWAKESKYIQPIVFGLLALIAGVIVLSFPETKTRSLPETLDEVRVPWFDWFGLRKTTAGGTSETGGPGYDMQSVPAEGPQGNSAAAGTGEKKGVDNVSYVSAT